MDPEIVRVFFRKDSDYQFPCTYRPRKEYLNVRALTSQECECKTKRANERKENKKKKKKEEQVDGVRRFVAGDEQIGRGMEKEKRRERWQRSTDRGRGGEGGGGKEML